MPSDAAKWAARQLGKVAIWLVFVVGFSLLPLFLVYNNKKMAGEVFAMDTLLSSIPLSFRHNPGPASRHLELRLAKSRRQRLRRQSRRRAVALHTAFRRGSRDEPARHAG